MNTNDRYGVANCMGGGDGGMDRPKATVTEFISKLLSDDFKQTATMYMTYPDGYNHGVADTNNRRYENTSYQLLEKVDRKLQVTPKGHAYWSHRAWHW